jgi:hypothetical protein
MVKRKIKTLVEIELSIWAKVRYFATLNRIPNNAALEALLVKALKNHDAEEKTLQTLASSENKIIPVTASFEANSNQVSEEVH